MPLDLLLQNRINEYRRISSALKVTALSQSSFHLIRDIRLIRAIVRSRPQVYGSDPRDYLNLPHDLFPPSSGGSNLRNAIASIAGQRGTLLGLQKDINLAVDNVPSEGGLRHDAIYRSL
ncbi:hypothetical protein JCM5350_005565 [Sporobolomyces pararoseus]